MAELADARDLKSREIFSRTGSTPASGTIYIAGWSSLVARRAHNPKVMRFKSHLRNQKNSNHQRWFEFFLFGREGNSVLHDLRGYESECEALRANNLQPKLKQLGVVLTTVDTTKQGVGRAECTEAIANDYATCAVGREVQIPLPQPKELKSPTVV